MTNPLGRALIVLAALMLNACGEADDSQAAVLSGGGTPMLPLTDGCLEGQTRDCRLVTSVREGYSDCVRGVQYCKGTSWGPCVAPVDGGEAKLVAEDDAGDAGPAEDDAGGDAASSD